jgi:hypothetical protein
LSGPRTAAGGDRTEEEEQGVRRGRIVIRAFAFTCFFFGFAGWWYIAQNAVHHPETLRLPLTHLMPWPREDTFGIVCFAVSFVSLFVYMLTRGTDRAGP